MFKRCAMSRADPHASKPEHPRESGDSHRARREAALEAALRNNLKRRKAAPAQADAPNSAPDPEDGATPMDETI